MAVLQCNHTFAGGSYVPQSPAHITVLRAVQAVKTELARRPLQLFRQIKDRYGIQMHPL